MRIIHARVLVSSVLALGLASGALALDPERVPAATGAAPEPADGADPSSQVLPDLPGPVKERLRQLEEKDPGAFRDLLRRTLAARLIRRLREGDSYADFPVELAGEMASPGR